MATKNHAVQKQERSLKRALLYQLSYAPTPSQDNTSIAADVLAENHNTLRLTASGCGRNSVARRLFVRPLVIPAKDDSPRFLEPGWEPRERESVIPLIVALAFMAVVGLVAILRRLM